MNNYYTIFMDLLISMDRVEGINEADMNAAVSQLSMDEQNELRHRLITLLEHLRPALPVLKLVNFR